MLLIPAYTLIVSLLLASSCFMSHHQQAAHHLSAHDTLVLARSDRPIALNTEAPVQKALLNRINNQTEKTKKKLMLCLYDVKQEKPPEGVYELYLTPENPKEENLQPQSVSFVSVLDTYTLATHQQQKLCIALPEAAAKQLIHSAAPGYFVTLLFRGNILPGKQLSTNAGNLRVQKIELMLVN